MYVFLEISTGHEKGLQILILNLNNLRLSINSMTHKKKFITFEQLSLLTKKSQVLLSSVRFFVRSTQPSV